MNPEVKDKMNPEVKAKWLAKLRSKEVKQGRERLKGIMPDGTAEFCCLGVLCDIYAQEKGVDWTPLDDAHHGQDINCEILDAVGTPPSEIVNWAGLPERNPVLNTNLGAARMTSINDEMEMTFDQLADLIEAQL